MFGLLRSNLSLLALGLVLLVWSIPGIRFFIKYPKFYFGALVWFWGLGMVAVRIFDFPRSELQPYFNPPPYDMFGEFVRRAVNLGIIYISLLGLIAGLTLLEKRSTIILRGWKLWASSVAFAFGTLLAAFFSQNPTFSYKLLLLPLLFTTCYLLLKENYLRWLLIQMQGVLLIILTGSLVSAIIVPEWAFLSNYTRSFIPDFNLRLIGLMAHPNILGPIALLYLSTIWLYPKRLHYWMGLPISLSVLVLAQSLTAIIVGLIFLLIFIMGPTLYRSSSWAQRVLVAMGALAIMLLPAVWVSRANKELRSEANIVVGGRLESRYEVWKVALELWSDNPLFGYGLDAWSLENRLKYGKTQFLFAGQAHNQLLQALSTTGIIGTILWLIYTLILLYVGIFYSVQTKGASLGLVLLLVVRAFSESPFDSLSIGETFMVHAYVFLLLMNLDKAGMGISSALTKGSIGQLPSTSALNNESKIISLQ